MAKFITKPYADSAMDFSNSVEHEIAVGDSLTGVNGLTRIFQEIDPVDFDLFVPQLGNLSPAFIASSSYAASGGTVTIDLTVVSAGDWLVIGASCDDFANGDGIGAVTLGDGTTAVAGTLLDKGNSGQLLNTGFFKIQCPANAAGNASARLTLSNGGTNVTRCAAGVWKVAGEPSLAARVWQYVSDAAPSMADLSLVTPENGSLFVCGTGTSANAPVPAGFAVEGSTTGIGRAHWRGSASPTTSGTRTVTVDSDARMTAHAVVLTQ